MQFPLVYTGNRVTIEKFSDRLYFRQGVLNARRQCNGGYVVTEEGVVAVDAPSVEVEMIRFGRQILPVSYLLAAVLTLAFTLIVSVVMSRKLRKVDMVESLKSVE